MLQSPGGCGLLRPLGTGCPMGQEGFNRKCSNWSDIMDVPGGRAGGSQSSGQCGGVLLYPGPRMECSQV